MKVPLPTCAEISRATTAINQPWMQDVAERGTEYFQIVAWSFKHSRWEAQLFTPARRHKIKLPEPPKHPEPLTAPQLTQMFVSLPVSKYFEIVLKGCRETIQSRPRKN